MILIVQYQRKPSTQYSQNYFLLKLRRRAGQRRPFVHHPFLTYSHRLAAECSSQTCRRHPASNTTAQGSRPDGKDAKAISNPTSSDGPISVTPVDDDAIPFQRRPKKLEVQSSAARYMESGSGTLNSWAES